MAGFWGDNQGMSKIRVLYLKRSGLGVNPLVFLSGSALESLILKQTPVA